MPEGCSGLGVRIADPILSLFPAYRQKEGVILLHQPLQLLEGYAIRQLNLCCRRRGLLGGFGCDCLEDLVEVLRGVPGGVEEHEDGEDGDDPPKESAPRPQLVAAVEVLEMDEDGVELVLLRVWGHGWMGNVSRIAYQVSRMLALYEIRNTRYEI